MGLVATLVLVFPFKSWAYDPGRTVAAPHYGMPLPRTAAASGGLVRDLDRRPRLRRARQQAQQCLCGTRRGCRILTREQAPIDNREGLPIGHLLELATELLQLILHQEGHDVSELDFFFLRIRESGDAFPLISGVPDT